MKRHAFTLIELLIVVAIIAILASIAIVNFLEAQTRSKVSRVKADMRSLATAIESYRTDANKYPFYLNEHDQGFPSYPRGALGSLNDRAYNFVVPIRLTTPVAYITSIPDDVFPNKKPGTDAEKPNHPFHYSNDDDFSANPDFPDPTADRYPVKFLFTIEQLGRVPISYGGNHPKHPIITVREYLNQSVEWVLVSHGPDLDYDNLDDFQISSQGFPIGDIAPVLYDPTNGTISGGDIYYWGPGIGLK